MTETTTLPIEVRAVDDAQRTATFLVCKYGETSRRTAKPERFLPGAFTKSVLSRADRIPFTDRHTDGTGRLRAPAVARPVQWDVSDPTELRAVVRFFDSYEGWTAYTRARDREIDAGSVGFAPIEERTVDGVREISEAAMHHFALLSRADGVVPAYDEPRLLEVRAADIAALLAVKYDPAIAEGCVDAAELAKLGIG